MVPRPVRWPFFASLAPLVGVLVAWPARAVPIPRVDLPEGLSLEYRTAERIPFFAESPGVEAGFDWRKGPLTGGMQFVVGSLPPKSEGSDPYRIDFVDAFVEAAMGLYETPWLSLGPGTVLGVRWEPSRGTQLRAGGFGLCASLHTTATVGGHALRFFADPALLFALFDDSTMDLWAGTGFVVGLEVDRRVEVTLGVNASGGGFYYEQPGQMNFAIRLLDSTFGAVRVTF